MLLRPPRDRSIARRPFSERARTIGVQLDDRAVQGQCIQLQPGQLVTQQLAHDPLQHAGLGRAIEPHVDRVPGTQLGRQAAPAAAFLRDVEQRIRVVALGYRQLAARRRQQRRVPHVLTIRQSHLVTSRTAARAHSDMSTRCCEQALLLAKRFQLAVPELEATVLASGVKTLDLSKDAPEETRGSAQSSPDDLIQRARAAHPEFRASDNLTRDQLCE